MHTHTYTYLQLEGDFVPRRLIISEKGELYICASTRGVTKEGTFKRKTKSRYLSTKGYRMSYSERYFVLADGTFKYWENKVEGVGCSV